MGRWLCVPLAWFLMGCHSTQARDASAEDPAIDWGPFDPVAEREKEEAQAKAEAKKEARRRRWEPRPPRTMRVIPGQAPPAGYVEVRRPNWLLLGAGVGLFATTYALPAASALRMMQSEENSSAWTMLVPVVGPLLQIGYLIDGFAWDDPAFGLYSYFGAGMVIVGLAALSFVQAGALALPILAFTERRRVWLRSDLALIQTPRLSAQLRFTGTSLEVVGRF